MYVYIPIGSMYGIFTYIWVIFGVNVGKYSIHGSYGEHQTIQRVNHQPFRVLTLGNLGDLGSIGTTSAWPSAARGLPI